ncbi:ABC transporter permease [Mycoplasma zalophi]|uniref:ABC transporter permease subunit n=1 Tax=Mycoplasma zalophi TaxID=191287 RepID=A0ABS6DPB0_9MOLU|nr:ABC transporter permease subunit [Mycoplasma zalophi]MBU4691060.1 ABC transporter permease subunit [Mycoplasma zalophi]MBU4692160.1 ABC transporter permease subunit [Mycoplasma zalophi]
MQSNNFKFIDKLTDNNDKVPLKQTEQRQFWKRFFSKKINYFILALFILSCVCLISFRIFIQYNPEQSVSVENDLVNNLNPALNPLIKRNFERGDTLNFVYKIRDLEEIRAKNLLIDPVFKILFDSSYLAGGGNKTINTDIVTLIYNPYDLLKAIELNGLSNEIHNYNFILGTNANGIDIWSRVWYSIFNTIAILVIVTFLNAIIGTFLGSYVALNENKFISKVVVMISYVISSIPEIIWIILLCALYNGSLLSIFVSFLVISWVPFYELTKQEVQRLRNLDFILASKAIGKNNFQIIFTDIFSNIFSVVSIFFVERIALGILIVSAISFLDFINNSSYATIGVVLKESIESLSQNPYFFITIISSLTIIIFSFKFFANSLAFANEVKTTK